MTIETCQLCFCLKRGCAEDPIYSIITLGGPRPAGHRTGMGSRLHLTFTRGLSPAGCDRKELSRPTR
jgi:hypothetical protein